MISHHYSIPQACKELLDNGILQNPLIQKHVPHDLATYGERVKFHGSSLPSIPINWRFAESVSALKGFEAMMIMALVKRKYGKDVEEVLINS